MTQTGNHTTSSIGITGQTTVSHTLENLFNKIICFGNCVPILVERAYAQKRDKHM